MRSVLNPFALPVHAPLVHFPIAMLVVAWGCLVLRYATGNVAWDARARMFQIVGVASLPVVLVAAIIDTRGLGFVFRPRWDGPLIWHALAGLLAAALATAHFAWRRRLAAEQMTGRVAVRDLVSASAGVWVLILVGMIAGEMVFAR